MTKRMALLSMGIVLAAGAPALGQQLAVGTMGQGTANYSIAAALASVVEQNSDYRMIVQPSAGTTAFLPLLHSAEMDFAIVNAVEAEGAVTGQAPFDRALDEIKAVSVLFPLHVGIFVRADSEFQALSDLRGARMTYGYTSQGTVGPLVDALLANGGLTAEDIEPVMVPNVVRGADDFAAGQSDAAYFAVGAGKVAEVAASVGGVRFLPVSTQADDVAAMQGVLRQTYVDVVQPAPNRPGIDVPTPVMAVDYVLLAGTHVPDEVVADMAALLATHTDALATTFPGFNNFALERMSADAGAPFHDGAKAFFSSNNIPNP